MGADIHLYICKYNPEDNLFHELCLYHKIEGDYKKVPIYDGRDYEMFDAINNKSNYKDFGIFPHSPIAFNSLEPQLRKIVEHDIFEEIGTYGDGEVTFSDLLIYVNNHPTVFDYEADWEASDLEIGDPKPQKINPIKTLYETCIHYTEFAEKWGVMEDSLSRYKILYWFDH